MTKTTPMLAALLGALLSTTALAQSTDAPTNAEPATDTPIADTDTTGTRAETEGTEGTDAGAAPANAAPADPTLAMGETEGNRPGAPYAAEQIGDWTLQCIPNEGGDDPCQMYQLLADSDGNAVAEFTLFRLPEGQQAAAGAMIAVPLETLLTQQLTIQIDSGGAKRYPFMFCNTVGCYARVGFTAQDIASFKRGNVAKMSIVPMLAPDQKVELNLSLTGFTATYDKVTVAPAPQQ